MYGTSVEADLNPETCSWFLPCCRCGFGVTWAPAAPELWRSGSCYCEQVEAAGCCSEISCSSQPVCCSPPTYLQGRVTAVQDMQRPGVLHCCIPVSAWHNTVTTHSSHRELHNLLLNLMFHWCVDLTVQHSDGSWFGFLSNLLSWFSGTSLQRWCSSLYSQHSSGVADWYIRKVI